MAVDTPTLRMVKSGMSAKRDGVALTYKIKCTSMTDTCYTVYSNAIVPKKGSTPDPALGLPTDWVINEAEVTPMGETLYWFMINIEVGPRQTGSWENPLDYVRVWGGGVSVMRPTRYDADGARIVNAAGDLFQPLLERPVGAGQFGVEFRKTSLTAYSGISNSVNSTAIWGLAAKTILIGEVSWQASSEDDVKFWQISIPMTYDPAGWQEKREQAGWNYKPTSGARAIAATWSKEPVYLNANGTLLAVGGTVIEKELKKFRSIAFPTMPNPFVLP